MIGWAMKNIDSFRAGIRALFTPVDMKRRELIYKNSS
jgi:hypothetical protein